MYYLRGTPSRLWSCMTRPAVRHYFCIT